MPRSFAKQIFILKNLKSNFFDEAIFIIKDGKKAEATDLLTECERIVDEQNKSFLQAKSNKKALYASVATVLIILFLIMVCYLIFR